MHKRRDQRHFLVRQYPKGIMLSPAHCRSFTSKTWALDSSLRHRAQHSSRSLGNPPGPCGITQNPLRSQSAHPRAQRKHSPLRPCPGARPGRLTHTAPRPPGTAVSGAVEGQGLLDTGPRTPVPGAAFLLKLARPRRRRTGFPCRGGGGGVSPMNSCRNTREAM